jgi:hypothetical protein
MEELFQPPVGEALYHIPRVSLYDSRVNQRGLPLAEGITEVRINALANLTEFEVASGCRPANAEEFLNVHAAPCFCTYVRAPEWSAVRGTI